MTGHIFLVHNVKAYNISGGLSPLILNLNFRPRPPYLPYPLNWWLVVPSNRSGWLGEEKNCLSLVGFEVLTVQPVVWSLHQGTRASIGSTRGA